ncbi:MAG: DUF885 family protein [Planctomycetia bacterium]|nr:DUF885 family protein [Planctomycetia bacterium]
MQRLASRPAVLFISLAIAILFTTNREHSGLAAPQAPAAAPNSNALDLSDLNGASELRGVIERFDADRGSVRRSLGAASPRRDARMTEFHQQWLDKLEKLEFDKLSHDGKVDYLLLKSYLERELRQLELRAKADAESAPFVPFDDVIYQLDESRRRLDAMDWAKTAAALTDLTKHINDARRKVESLSGESRPKRALANRAAQSVDNLRSTLRDWQGFYNGYDPLFTWWMDEPYKATEAALSGYADFLRQRFVGGGTGAGPRPDVASRSESGGSGGGPGSGASGGGRFSRRGESSGSSSGLGSEPSRDGGDIIGNPIGREALLSELAYEMVPYAPEDLVALAEQEFAWCEAEMKKASNELGCGDDWKKALEHVKNQHVEPGKQPELIRQLALEAVDYIERNDLVTVPPLCAESWRMAMMTPDRQMVNPFFTGGETITVSFPTSTMPHEAKLMSMRGNNVHFARATVHHELIPGHHLQGYMISRYRTYRGPFSTAFWTEGWALYWEMLLYDMDFPRSPENRVGMLFWRMHRCARIIFSLKFHLEQMSPQECIDFLVDRVGHERDNATAEVRRSFAGAYGPLYQAAYMLGGLQFRALHRELVESGKMTNRQFHDAILKENNIPVEMVRAILTKRPLTRDFKPSWKFYGPLPEAGAVEAP